MTQASLRPPASLQPRPKAVPTFSTTTTPQLSRPSSQSRQSSPARLRTTGPTDGSEKATAAFVRRILCPSAHDKDRPISEILPPLTSSNEIDFQLYAIIAVVVKDLVQTWYGKITPDHTFVEEVVNIIAHCTRALESRLRNVDFECLILDEIAALIVRHVDDYRVSHERHLSAPTTDPSVIYHDMNPHPALSPVPTPEVPSAIDEQRENEADYRQLLVQGALAVLLPTEDLENACLRTLVADVIAESILGSSIGGKVCQNWFMWSSIFKLTEAVKAKMTSKSTGTEIEIDTRSRLEKFGLLAEKEEKSEDGKQSRRSSFSSFFWRALQYIYMTVVTFRFIFVGIIAASRGPLRSSSMPRPAKSVESSPLGKSFLPSRPLRPILSFTTFALISTIFDLSVRMPWLVGFLSLLRHHLIYGPLKLGGTDGILDQYLHHLLTTSVDPQTFLPHLLFTARQTLFPNLSMPPPAPPPPSLDQIAEIRRQCATSILSLLPPSFARQFFSTEKAEGEEEMEEWIRQVDTDLLEVWADAYLNKHLAYAILELVVVRVLPELGEKGVKELMEARLGEQISLGI